LLNATNIGWPPTNVHFADESNSLQPASVRRTEVSSYRGVRRVGHIDQRKLRRRVGPEQVAHSMFVTSVKVTAARNASA
jgi:hypothetical protein